MDCPYEGFELQRKQTFFVHYALILYQNDSTEDALLNK